MSFQKKIKSFVEECPESVAKYLSYVPFVCRLGPSYSILASKVSNVGLMGDNKDNVFSFQRLRDLVVFAYENVDFYRYFYDRAGFSPASLKSYSDWQNVPIVTKRDFQDFALKDRACKAISRRLLLNTGGTSGQPLEFFVESDSFASEWAHMHCIWMSHGYRVRDAKLTFRGKRFSADTVFKYNAVHNEYIVNSSSPMSEVIVNLPSLLSRCSIKWVHGYPSLIAEFAAHIKCDALLAARFRSGLRGCLLSSEYPSPQYRSEIEEVLSANIVSWYGHSEMCVLAREVSRGVYESMPTYGYTEAVNSDDGVEGSRLISTSLCNRVHPFIRYDTGDLVELVASSSDRIQFKIKEGRVGDFVVDRAGNKISLTAMIFGRHHEAFSLIRHLQVRQHSPGMVTFIVTLKDQALKSKELIEGFDLDGLNMDIDFEIVEEPVRTNAGKIKLKV